MSAIVDRRHSSSLGPQHSRAHRFQTLLSIYDGLLGNGDDEHARAVSHPSMTSLKWRLEQEWLLELPSLDHGLEDLGPGEAADAMRRLAARNRIPEVYRWVAECADGEQLRVFVAAEGGPDGGFDDLVAIAQVGLSGKPKMELATNYWDELGNGALEEIHTDLHRVTTREMDLRPVPRDQMSELALQRAALPGLLATNHWLQPEMLGALGMIELQAGPRCQQVLKAMARLGVSETAQAFYRVHAEVDPRHGADWMTNVVEPVCEERPEWAARILRGAGWRLSVNDSFLQELHQSLTRLNLASGAA